MKDKHTSLPGCCCATGVSPTTRDNSVQPPIKETLHILALLCHNHTAILLMLFNTPVKYLPLQITEHDSKHTWLPLGKARLSYDARQQRAAKDPHIVKRILFSYLILRKNLTPVRLRKYNGQNDDNSRISFIEYEGQ